MTSSLWRRRLSAETTPNARSGIVARTNDIIAADDDVADTDWWLDRIGVAGAVAHGARLDNHQVRPVARREPPDAREAKGVGWKTGHAVDRLFQRQYAALADIASQHTGER